MRRPLAVVTVDRTARAHTKSLHRRLGPSGKSYGCARSRPSRPTPRGRARGVAPRTLLDCPLGARERTRERSVGDRHWTWIMDCMCTCLSNLSVTVLYTYVLAQLVLCVYVFG